MTHRDQEGRRQPVFELLDDETVARLKAMSGAERLAIAFALGESVRASLKATLRSKHPSWSEEAVEREVARRFLEDDLP